MPTDLVEKLRQVIEWSVLELIKQLTQADKMTDEQAQRLAKHVLACVKPHMGPEDFFKGALTLNVGYPELSYIVVPLARKYRDKIELPTTTKIREYIRKAHYDEAVKMADDLISKNIKLKFVAKGKK